MTTVSCLGIVDWIVKDFLGLTGALRMEFWGNKWSFFRIFCRNAKLLDTVIIVWRIKITHFIIFCHICQVLPLSITVICSQTCILPANPQQNNNTELVFQIRSEKFQWEVLLVFVQASQASTKCFPGVQDSHANAVKLTQGTRLLNQLKGRADKPVRKYYDSFCNTTVSVSKWAKTNCKKFLFDHYYQIRSRPSKSKRWWITA